MQNMTQLNSRKKCQFRGAVNEYHDMWGKISHKLLLLTNITSSKVKFQWTKIEQYTFDKINWIVARDNLSDYPDFNE